MRKTGGSKERPRLKDQPSGFSVILSIRVYTKNFQVRFYMSGEFYSLRNLKTMDLDM